MKTYCVSFERTVTVECTFTITEKDEESAKAKAAVLAKAIDENTYMDYRITEGKNYNKETVDAHSVDHNNSYSEMSNIVVREF